MRPLMTPWTRSGRRRVPLRWACWTYQTSCCVALRRRCFFFFVHGELRANPFRRWLLVCRRLAVVGYSALERITITPQLTFGVRSFPSSSSAVDWLVSAPGQQMERRLASLSAFLGHMHLVRHMVLDQTAHYRPDDPGRRDAYRLWWDMVLPALSRLPIRSLSAGEGAVSALVDAPIGTVPLRHLKLLPMCHSDREHWRGALSVLTRHQQSLERLVVDAFCSAPIAEGGGEPWSVASLFGPVGGLPALTALTLCCPLTTAIAKSVAAACPALESLTLKQDIYGEHDEGVLGCWKYPEALPRLSSLHVRSGCSFASLNDDTGFSRLMRGRRLRQLTVGEE